MSFDTGFEMKHLIFPVRENCTLRIQCVFPMRVNPQESYTLSIHPFSGLRRYGLRHSDHMPTEEDAAFFAHRHQLTVQGNDLVMDLVWPQEDRYICRMYVGETHVKTMEVYALEADLFAKQPFKGDNHMHTYMSDGKDSPMYMAAAACRHGYDYCVITDHKLYEPSLIARDFFAPTGVDFLVIPGEEVHSPDNPVHIINLGGNHSVNDWWRDHEEEYRAAVAQELSTMDDPMLDEDRYTAAASQVMFDKIHEADGVAVLCHPNWIIGHGFNEHEDVTDYLFEHRRFDALELIAGGAYEVGTQMQLSYYNDCPNMSILGNSDAHACFGEKLEPGNYTIVFAEALTGEAIKDAIRTGLTVAADDNRFYGDYRLVKYAYFLQKNYFPSHKQMRNTLGAQMVRFASSRMSADSPMGAVLSEIKPSRSFAPKRYSRND